MTPRFMSDRCVWLALLAVPALPWAGAAHAQAPAPARPPAAVAGATPSVYRSAFEGYKPYTDESPGNWKEANDTTARVGGWRVYAREAGATQPPAAAAAAQPGSDSARPRP